MRRYALILLPAVVAASLPGCTASRPLLSAAPPETTALATTAEESTTEMALPWWNTALDDDLALPETTLVPRTELSETQTEPETQTETTAAIPSTTRAVTTTAKPATTTAALTETTTEAQTTAAATTQPSTTTTTTRESTTTTTAKPAAATTKPASNKAAQTVRAAAGSAQEAINRATLHPMTTGNDELDDRVRTILASITTPSMSTYDKVRAIYNYIIDHVEYGRNSLNQSDELRAYETPQDAIIVLCALDTLKEGVGVCDDYAALFLVMTRAVGLDCWYSKGSTTNTKGETKAHVWNTITVGGQEYLFDAQVEDKQSANGVKYTFFGKTYDDAIVQKVYSGHDLAADKASFGYFKRIH